MAKKLNAKQLREKQKLEKNNKISELNAQRQAKAEENTRQKLLSEAKSRKYPTKKEGRKSLAKAAGLKSTLIVGDNIYLTTFGKGEKAILEKKISSNGYTSLRSNQQNEVLLLNNDSITGKHIHITNSHNSQLSTNANNPLYNRKTDVHNTDMLLLKDTLEYEYFGKTFDDNIHIQIIYNILDIEKILTIHSVNTVFALNNIYDDEKIETTDFIGTLSFQTSYKEYIKDKKKKKELANYCKLPALAYYNNIFNTKSQENTYTILAIIASIRHWCVHYEDDKRTWLYNPDKYLSKDFINILDYTYRNMVKDVKDKFISNNHVNIIILSKVLEIYDDNQLYVLINKYYSFIVKKEHKNLGISIAKLRQKAIEKTKLFSSEYNFVRPKINKLIDFLFYYNYTTNCEEAKITETIIEKLRHSLTEESKEKIYSDEAQRLWEKYADIIDNKIKIHLSKNNLSKYQKNKDIIKYNSSKIITDNNISEDISYFSKIIFLLAQFIDDKDVNNLTSQLANKLDNINSFINIAKEIGIECKFTYKYSLFNHSNDLSQEIIRIKNITMINKSIYRIRPQMYSDAYNILNIDKENKQVSKFIRKNVINSNRFVYLAKYCNTSKIHEIVSNPKILKFILGRIPEIQVKNYYLQIDPHHSATSNTTKEEMQQYLLNRIVKFSINDINDADHNITYYQKCKSKRLIQAQATLLKLYLTICYIFVKNLVNINSRYVIAFHCLERDAFFYRISYPKSKVKDYSILVKELISDNYRTAKNLHLRNKKWHALTMKNLNNYDAQAEKEFRNSVAHLNPIRNANLYLKDIDNVTSYFEIYHYIVQKSIINRIHKKKFNNQYRKYESLIYNNKNYCKDMVKALCVPFAYNIPRFKALSIYENFNMNNNEELSD